MKRMFWRSRSVLTEEVENGTQVRIDAKRPHRRMKVILTSALSAALGGFLISYVFSPKYTSQSTVLVESQKLPDALVQSIITANFSQRIQTLSQQVLSPTRLRPVIQSLALAKPEEEGKLISDIQQNMSVEPVITSMGSAANTDGPSDDKNKASTTNEPPPGFNVNYTDSSPIRAQKICNALTSLIVDENLKERGDMVKSTVDFLSRQLEEAKRTLDDQDVKIAAFKTQYKSRIATDPGVELRYNLLTRDSDNNEAFYKDLLTKRNAAELSASMENQQMGEQMYVLASASLPDAPDFPNRLLFALWGLCAGLLFGISRVIWPAARKLLQRLALLLPIDADPE